MELLSGGKKLSGKGPGNITREDPSEMHLAPPSDGMGLVHVLVLFFIQNSPFWTQFPHSDQPPSVVACGDVACNDVSCGDVACGDVACGDVACGDVACGNVACGLV